MLVDEPGRTTFREHMSDGPLIMTVVSRTPPTQFVTKIDDPDQPLAARGRSTSSAPPPARD
jgi:hypothetical protein